MTIRKTAPHRIMMLLYRNPNLPLLDIITRLGAYHRPAVVTTAVAKMLDDGDLLTGHTLSDLLAARAADHEEAIKRDTPPPERVAQPRSVPVFKPMTTAPSRFGTRLGSNDHLGWGSKA